MAETVQNFDKSKKGVFGATVAPPTQQADFFAQLRNTFERGVVSAEIDLSGLWNEKAGMHGARSVGDAEKRQARHLIAEHGGMATFHAPLGFDLSASMSLSQRKGAQALKETVEYANEVTTEGTKSSITLHPSMLMGASFIDPATGSEQTLPKAFYLCRTKDELNAYIKDHHVSDELVKKQIMAEWINFAGAQAVQFQQQNASFAPQTVRKFAQDETRGMGMSIFVNELKDKNLSKEDQILRVGLKLARMRDFAGTDEIREEANQALNLFNQNKEKFVSDMGDMVSKREKLWKEESPDAYKNAIEKEGSFAKFLKKRNSSTWASAAAATGGKITREGFSSDLLRNEFDDKEFEKELFSNNGVDRETVNTTGAEGAIFLQSISGERRGDMAKDGLERVENAFMKTMKMFLDDEKVVNDLKQGKTQLNLENLWGSTPDKGMYEGIPFFNDPKNMAKVVKKLQDMAVAKGLSKDVFGVTFDTQHAMASGMWNEKENRKMKASEWLDELKNAGVDVSHIHLVGGSDDSKGHVAFGDWNDQLAKDDPKLWNKLVEQGAIINIEGGKGVEDVEKTLEAMWNEGVPLEAIAAAAHAPDEVKQLGYADMVYSGVSPSFYGEMAQNYGEIATKGGLYAFGPSLAQPGLAQFGASLAPGMYSGGIMHRDISQMGKTYMTAQPLLYSSGGNQ